jgi:hypothetical protein
MRCGKELECAERYPSSRTCPDCEADLGFPNVRQAKKSGQALKLRYDEAKNRHAATITKMEEFEDSVVQGSNVVLTVRREFLLNFLNSGNSLYLSYHRLVDAGLRFPAQQDDHIRRVESDNALFGAYKDHIIFCALSITSTGAWGYGDYHLTLRINLIETRLTFTQYNTFGYQKWFDEIVDTDGHKCWREKLGFRAEWSTRAQLAVAKHADDVKFESRRAEFGTILLKSKGNRAEEDFIEGHIYGGLSRQAVATVRAPTDAELREICGEKNLTDSRRVRRSISGKLDGLKQDRLSIDFKCGD